VGALPPDEKPVFHSSKISSLFPILIKHVSSHLGCFLLCGVSSAQQAVQQALEDGASLT
jgi:hypothetical protein